MTEKADLGTRLHEIAGLEQLPKLFLNVSELSQNGHHDYPTRFMGHSWKVAAFSTAVQALLVKRREEGLWHLLSLRSPSEGSQLHMILTWGHRPRPTPPDTSFWGTAGPPGRAAL
jgi:hypothetical protein